MSKITIEINTDNAAFSENAFELEDIMEFIKTRLNEYDSKDIMTFRVRDSNGNSCGLVTIDNK